MKGFNKGNLTAFTYNHMKRLVHIRYFGLFNKFMKTARHSTMAKDKFYDNKMIAS